MFRPIVILIQQVGQGSFNANWTRAKEPQLSKKSQNNEFSLSRLEWNNPQLRNGLSQPKPETMASRKAVRAVLV